MEQLRPFFPKSHGKSRVDDRRVLSGVVFVNRNGLRWRDVPDEYGPHKTLYNRWKRWDGAGVFTRMMEGLAAAGAAPQTVMIDATYLKAHCTASSLRVGAPITREPLRILIPLMPRHLSAVDVKNFAGDEAGFLQIHDGTYHIGDRAHPTERVITAHSARVFGV